MKAVASRIDVAEMYPFVGKDGLVDWSMMRKVIYIRPLDIDFKLVPIWFYQHELIVRALDPIMHEIQDTEWCVKNISFSLKINDGEAMVSALRDPSYKPDEVEMQLGSWFAMVVDYALLGESPDAPVQNRPQGSGIDVQLDDGGSGEAHPSHGDD